MNGKASSGAALAPIEDDATYPLPVFKAITGMGDTAIRKARRQGLAVQYIGRQAFVAGKSFRAYLDAMATGTKPGSQA